MAIERRWLRIKEASEYLALHPASVYRSCKRKQLPHAKFPGIGIRIDKQELDAMLERREIQPGDSRRR